MLDFVLGSPEVCPDLRTPIIHTAIVASAELVTEAGADLDIAAGAATAAVSVGVGDSGGDGAQASDLAGAAIGALVGMDSGVPRGEAIGDTPMVRLIIIRGIGTTASIPIPLSTTT